MTDNDNEENRPSDLEKPWEVYPEMRDYPWVKDYDRVVANSKFISGGGLMSEMPKVPINLLLTVMREASSRPEIMAAYGSAKLDETIPFKERHMLGWYEEYLNHKYGTEPDPVMEMIFAMRELANGKYSGLDDPKLRSDLMARYLVCEDDGKDYG